MPTAELGRNLWPLTLYGGLGARNVRVERKRPFDLRGGSPLFQSVGDQLSGAEAETEPDGSNDCAAHRILLQAIADLRAMQLPVSLMLVGSMRTILRL